MILLIVRAVFYISFQVSGTDVILKSYMAKLRWGNSQKSTLYERIIKFILKKKERKQGSRLTKLQKQKVRAEYTPVRPTTTFCFKFTTKNNVVPIVWNQLDYCMRILSVLLPLLSHIYVFDHTHPFLVPWYEYRFFLQAEGYSHYFSKEV